MKAFGVLVLCLLSSALNAAASWERDNGHGFRLKATLSNEQATLTDPLTLSLQVTTPTGYSANVESLKKNLTAFGEMTENWFQVVDTKSSNEGNTTTYTFTLDPLIPGEHYLTFHIVTIAPSDTKQENLQLLSGVFPVTISLPNETSLQSAAVLPLTNKPLLELDVASQQQQEQSDEATPRHNQQVFVDHSFPWHYLLIYPLALLLVYGCAKLIQRTLKRLHKEPVVPLPSDIAQKDLGELAKSNLVADGNFEGFYVELTKILREYIEKEYDVHAVEMTTEEFMQWANKQTVFDEKTHQALVDLLTLADKVKFSQERPTPEQCQAALAYARQFVASNQPPAI